MTGTAIRDTEHCRFAAETEAAHVLADVDRLLRDAAAYEQLAAKEPDNGDYTACLFEARRLRRIAEGERAAAAQLTEGLGQRLRSVS